LQIYNFITSEDIMTVTKDLCGWCSFGYEQLVCACVWSMHTSGCSFTCRQRGRSSAKTQQIIEPLWKKGFHKCLLCDASGFYGWYSM